MGARISPGPHDKTAAKRPDLNILRRQTVEIDDQQILILGALLAHPNLP